MMARLMSSSTAQPPVARASKISNNKSFTQHGGLFGECQVFVMHYTRDEEDPSPSGGESLDVPNPKNPNSEDLLSLKEHDTLRR